MSGAATVLPGVPLPVSGNWTADVVPASPVSAPQTMLGELAVPNLHHLPAPAGLPLVAPPMTPVAHHGHRLGPAPKGRRRDKQPKPPKAGTAVMVPAKALKPTKPGKPAKATKPAAEGSRRRLMMLIAVAVVAAGAVAYYLMVLLPSMSEV